MKRWHKPEHESKEAPKVDVFLKEIIDVCKKHNMSIGHEDTHGGFIIHEGQDEEVYDWLMDATYQRERAQK